MVLTGTATRDDSVDLTNLELEQGILGALLLDTENTLWPQIAEQIKPEHFAEPLHSRIFEAVAKLAAAGTPPTPMMVQTYLAKDATLAEIGGVGYLASLASNAVTPMQVRSGVELLEDLADRRAFLNASKEAEEAAQTVTVGEPFRQALARHIEAMQMLFDKGSTRKTTSTLGEGGHALVERIARMRRGEADPNAIPTGIAALDRQTGGLHRGEYIILGARPSMGKTALALQVAYNIARNGGGVAYYSLEMPRDLLMPRVASCHLWTANGATNIPYSRILRGEVNDREARWISSFAHEIDAWPFLIDDAPGLSPSEMEARAQVAKARLERSGRTLDLVVVDHLHKMRQPGAQGKVAEYTEISARLAEMAKRLNCPVLTLAQLNRSVEGRDDKRPQLSDLRESGSIEQDADVAMFVYRPAYYLERERHADSNKEIERIQSLDVVKNRLDVIIEKQRSGPISTVELWCEVENNIVRDRSEGPVPGLEYAA